MSTAHTHPTPYPRVLWPNDCDMEGLADPIEMTHIAQLTGKIVVEGARA